MPLYKHNFIDPTSDEELFNLSSDYATQLFGLPSSTRPFCDLGYMLVTHYQHFMNNHFAVHKNNMLFDFHISDISDSLGFSPQFERYKIEVAKSGPGSVDRAIFVVDHRMTNDLCQYITSRLVEKKEGDAMRTIFCNDDKVHIQKIQDRPHWPTIVPGINYY